METVAETNAAEQSKASSDAVRKKIARRARELYELRGCVDGYALEDWVQAEREVMNQLAKEEAAPENSNLPADTRAPSTSGPQLGRKTATIAVRVGTFVYTGEYETNRCTSYKPGTLRKGQPIEIRFDQDKMFIELPDGRELETRIVKKIEQPSEGTFTQPSA